MPIYEYECENCGKLVESWQRISDAPLTTCETCGGNLHKLVSQSSFHLKGSGWYVTDYAGKKGGDSPAKSNESPSGTEKKAEKSTTSSTSTSPDA